LRRRRFRFCGAVYHGCIAGLIEAMKKLLLGSILACILAAQASRGASHALIIGIGKYRNFPESALDGPPNDARVLRDTLAKSWGFPAANIDLLLDEQATGAAIRHHLAALRDRVKTGDQVFVYFSGHGTSAYDKGSGALCSDIGSGCLVPYDIPRGVTAQQAASALILGSRDIRPVLLQMEQNNAASIFVVFDSCFSENSVKSILPRGRVTRELPMASIVRSGASKSVPAAAASDYPYRRVVFMSAAAKDETAQDIPQRLIASKDAQTIDGLPHGRMTDALLRGLRGDANRNDDQMVTYQELHQFVLSEMRGVQTPQLKVPEQSGLDQTPVFGVPKAPESPATTRKRDEVRVKVDPSAAALVAEIGKIPGVAVVTELPDFIVTSQVGRFVLSLENGLQLRSYAANQRADLMRRLAAELKDRQLMDYAVPHQKAQVTLGFEPEGRGTYCAGQQLDFKLTADRPVIFLLLNVDTAGTITVVHPSDAQPAKSSSSVLAQGGVQGPYFGAEYMKLFAFAEPPGDLNKWINAAFEPTDARFDELMTLLRTPEVSEASLVLYTAPRTAACGD
jgi:uncharacterized caspase-like protein